MDKNNLTKDQKISILKKELELSNLQNESLQDQFNEACGLLDKSSKDDGINQKKLHKVIKIATMYQSIIKPLIEPLHKENPELSYKKIAHIICKAIDTYTAHHNL